MNIFVLDSDPRVAARMHLDKHVVKMIIEYAQLLSTAHRLLDGKHELRLTPEGRKKNFYLLPGEKIDLFKDETGKEKLGIKNPLCYSLSHQNHPCAGWARESDTNYRWLFQLFEATSHEYTHRYGKVHKTWSSVKDFLRNPPRNIAAGDLTTFAQAMGEEFRNDDPVVAYRNYYLGPKAAFARWTNRPAPSWFQEGIENYDASTFERTTALG